MKQWQFNQNTENEYTIRLNGDDELNPQIVLDKIYAVLGPNAKISIQLEDSIPVLASNKRRAIINKYYT